MIRVLVVDDSKFMARALASTLQMMEFDVVAVAHDGLQGIEQFQLHHPDVILLDITMPNMDGVECLSQIRQLNPDARVVMLSAIRDQATVDRCLQMGASSFLQKPIRNGSPADLARLCQALETAVANPV